MGKTTRAGGGKAGATGTTRPGELLFRGDRMVIRDGVIEFGPGDGAAMDARLERASGGGLSLGLGDLTVDDFTVNDALNVTGITTLFSYVGMGASAGIAGALDVAGSAAGIWGPRDNTIVGATADPALQSGLTLLTGGTIYLAKIPIARDATPTKLLWYVTTGATTPTASECWVSVLSSAGAILATPVDVATASGTSGLKTTTVAPGALAANTFVWGAIVCAAAVLPTLASGPAAALTTLGNVGCATAAMRFATNGTSQTTITARTPASNSAGPAIWMGLDD